MSLAEYRDCPDCGTPVMRGPTLRRLIRWMFTAARIEPCSDSVPCGPGWLEYTSSGVTVWTVHSPAKCAHVAAHGGLRPMSDVEIVEMSDGESDWALWMYSQDVDTGGRCTCGHEGLGPSWHLSECRGANYALRQKVRELFIALHDGAPPPQRSG